MFSVCLPVHQGRGGTQSLVPGPFPAFGPRSFLGGEGVPQSGPRSGVPPPATTRTEGGWEWRGVLSRVYVRGTPLPRPLNPHPPGQDQDGRGGGRVRQSGHRSGYPPRNSTHPRQDIPWAICLLQSHRRAFLLLQTSRCPTVCENIGKIALADNNILQSHDFSARDYVLSFYDSNSIW